MKSLHEIVAELQREHGMRMLVYTRLIREGKLSPRLAQHRLDCIAEGIEHLRKLEQEGLSHGQAAA